MSDTLPPPVAPAPPSKWRRRAPWIVAGVCVLALVGALADSDDTTAPAAPPATTEPPATTVEAVVVTDAPTTAAPTTEAAVVFSDDEIARLATEWTWRDMNTTDRAAICDGYRLLGPDITRAMIPADMDPVSADTLWTLIERDC
jgi:hypothetical protein